MPDAEAIDPPSAPGGPDAAAEESDVGEGEHPQGELVTPDPPLSAQTGEHEVPDEIQEEEGADETVGDTPSTTLPRSRPAESFDARPRGPRAPPGFACGQVRPRTPPSQPQVTLDRRIGAGAPTVGMPEEYAAVPRLRPGAPPRRRRRGCAAASAAARRRPGGAAPRKSPRPRRRRPAAGSDARPPRVARPATAVKCTSRLSRARPESRWVAPSLRPSPSATSSSTRPADLRLFSSQAISSGERDAAARSAPARPPSGTWSGIVAAGVPGRLEYWNVNAPANRACAHHVERLARSPPRSRRGSRR